MKFDWNKFWECELAAAIRHPALLRSLLDQIDPKDPEVFELLFRSRFLTNLHEIMRREGKNAQGFDRMQQTFSESVIIIRELLVGIAQNTGWNSERYEQLDPMGMAALLDISHDLAIVKQWLVSSEETPVM